MDQSGAPGPIRDLKAFKKDGEVRKGRGSFAFIGILILTAGVFGWFFTGYKNQRKALFDKARIFEVIVDGAAVSRNNRPDVVDSVVQVPAGASIRIECETTRLRDEIRFEAKVGEALMPGELCDFEVAAPAVPGQKVPVKISMFAREDGALLHTVDVQVASIPPQSWFRITHLLVPGEDKTVSDEGLYVTHLADAFGKLMLTEAPADDANLLVGFLVGRANDPAGFVLAIDPAAAARGEITPVTAKLEKYRGYGKGGRGYWFRSSAPVAFGKPADGNVVFKAVAVVGTQADLDTIAHKAWEVQAAAPDAGGAKRVVPRGITVTDAKATAWNGWVSDDLRVIRVAAGQSAPRPVQWRSDKAPTQPAATPK